MAHPGTGKDRHIETCLKKQVESGSNGFQAYRLVGDLPDFRFEDLDLSTSLLGRRLRLPLVISSITGGGDLSGRINRNLAEAAQHLGIAMTVGSQRIMLEHPETRPSFEVRRYAPDILLFADLGLVHLNHGLTPQRCREAVESIGADGLALYLNPMHEAVQKNGMLDFTGLLDKLAGLCESFPYPIMVKEVGYGFSGSVLKRLRNCRIAALDVAGTGGTDWGLVEGASARARLSVGLGLGVPSAQALESAREIMPEDVALVASGGIRNGAEIAKSLAMGAVAAGMGLPFLRWASVSADRVVAEVERIAEELRLSLWYTGSRDVAALKGKLERL